MTRMADYLKQAEKAVELGHPSFPIPCPASELIYMHRVTVGHAMDAGLTAIARRNNCLRSATSYLPAHYSLNKRVTTMAVKIRIFLDTESRWQRCRLQALPPECWSELSKWLFRAAQCGVDLPRSKNQIEAVLKVPSGLGTKQPNS